MLIRLIFNVLHVNRYVDNDNITEATNRKINTSNIHFQAVSSKATASYAELSS